MAAINSRRNCGESDKTLHRIGKCGDGEQIWSWTAKKIAIILRTIPQTIPVEWTIFPDLAIYPTTRHRAVIWILAQLVCYCIHNTADDTTENYVEYVRRNKAKIYDQHNRQNLVATYLCVLDE
jgi:hypothetical protein